MVFLASLKSDNRLRYCDMSNLSSNLPAEFVVVKVITVYGIVTYFLWFFIFKIPNVVKVITVYGIVTVYTKRLLKICENVERVITACGIVTSIQLSAYLSNQVSKE